MLGRSVFERPLQDMCNYGGKTSRINRIVDIPIVISMGKFGNSWRHPSNLEKQGFQLRHLSTTVDIHMFGLQKSGF